MDYSRMGGAKPGTNKPKHREHNEKGSAKNPYGRPAPKAELIARLKAASKPKS